MTIKIRYSSSPEHVESMGTQALRDEFLVDNLFVGETFSLVYSHIDRLILGGAYPIEKTVRLPNDLKNVLGTSYLLERRELGAINIGGDGWVEVDGERYSVGHREAIYIPRGSKLVEFGSVDGGNAAKFYINCAPAHATYRVHVVKQSDAVADSYGSSETCNSRTIYKMIVPDIVETCQLVMGLTCLDSGSNWNTMPCHTHERRMEAYFYFGLPSDAAVLHLMGRPQNTRHIFVHNEQAVISPSWSIHSGSGTQAYSFIWSMIGENQDFSDMDHVKISELR